jgi:protein tyrosine/serine phosphatase
VNTRDLGGLRTEDGGETLYRRVVRSDSVRKLDEAGWAALEAYGVRTVVDLRFAAEVDADGRLEVPVGVVHVSLLGEPGELQVDDDGEIDPLELTERVYRESLHRFRPNVAQAIAAVGRAPEGGVVIHCGSGKDRTGVVVGVLLRLAGVEMEEVTGDYAVSERALAHELEAAVAADGADEPRERAFWAAGAPALLTVLAELERSDGGIRGYLLAGGATEEDLDLARARLLA